MRSGLAGWAAYGYCASRSRWFWGLRLHLITAPSGLPVAYALTSAKADERDTCLEMIARAGIARRGQTLIADKGLPPRQLRRRTQRRGHRPHPARHQSRAAPARATVPAPAAPDHRVGQPDASKPNSASNATADAPAQASPRAYCNDSSRSPQPSGNNQTTQQPWPRPLPDRLRPLTPWN